MGIDVDPPEDFLDQFQEGDRWSNPDGTLTSEARYFLEGTSRFNSDVWEKLGGSDDSISDAESVNDSSVLAKLASLSRDINELSMTRSIINIADVLRKIEELEMKNDNTSVIAILEKRISDLELQQ
ncbi:MAG: hypothetical protein JKX91_06500 [Rhizobiaceae bacterium]|nr:hypothetical protein [Rhizobiaceae bacterium]